MSGSAVEADQAQAPKRQRKGARPNSARQQKKRARREHYNKWNDDENIDHWDHVYAHYKEFHSLRVHLNDEEVAALLEGIEANKKADLEEHVQAAERAVSEKANKPAEVSTEEGEIDDSAAASATAANQFPPGPSQPAGITTDLTHKLMTSWYWAGYFQGLYEAQAGSAAAPAVKEEIKEEMDTQDEG